MGRRVDALRTRFAPRPNAIQTRAGAEALPQASVRAHWIVGRDLCMYRKEDFADVPRGRREAAVALQIPVWSPFERTGHHCVWSGSTAMVWFWDRDAVQVGGAELGLARGKGAAPEAVARTQTLPETVFYPRHADGLRIQACRAGFDLQYWRDQVLTDSVWLPEPPDERRIGEFGGRRAGAEDDLHIATAAHALAAQPWLSPLTPQAWLLANERALVLAGLAILIAVASFQEARYWRYHFADTGATDQLERLDVQLTPVLADRDELATLTRRNGILVGIMNRPSQAHLMRRVDRVIPAESTEFRAWRYQQEDLSMTLADDGELDTVGVVRNLQAEPLFADVQPGRSNRGGIEIKLRVDLHGPTP